MTPDVCDLHGHPWDWLQNRCRVCNLTAEDVQAYGDNPIAARCVPALNPRDEDRYVRPVTR